MSRGLHLLDCISGFADETIARGVNIRKGGADPPLKPAGEYPEWIKALSEQDTSLYDLRRKIEATGEDSLTFEEVCRLETGFSLGLFSIYDS